MKVKSEKEGIIRADVAVLKLSESVKAIVDCLAKSDKSALKKADQIKQGDDLMKPLVKKLREYSDFVTNNPDYCTAAIGFMRKFSDDIFKQLGVQYSPPPSNHCNVIESQLSDLYSELSLTQLSIQNFKA